MAHEINNPLTWVLANVEHLQSRLEAVADREVTELLCEVRDGARRIAATVSGMKGLSRVEARATAPVALKQVIEQAGRITQHELRQCARLVLDLAPVPDVLAHDVELGQVFINLLVNAAHAMPPGASPETHAITVTLRSSGERVTATVTDDGVGIDPGVRARLFDPFVSTKQGTGTGLGLAISRRIVEDSGGTIEVDSRPGKTSFTLTFPVAGPRPLPAPSASPPRTARLTVMVVDDEPLLGKATARLLLNSQVTVHTSGAQALAALVEGPLPDVIVCDLMMPGVSGIDLYERLALARPAALPRLIFMSGGAFTPRAIEFLATHPVRLIHKPFSTGELNAIVTDVARHAQA